MPEEKKSKILNVLKEFPGEKFNVRQICSMIPNVSYPTVLKWISVLEAESKIRVEDYGNVKIVRINEEYYKDGEEGDNRQN